MAGHTGCSEGSESASGWLAPRGRMEAQLAYFAELLVRSRSKELLGWSAQDLQHALEWAAYWERVARGGGGDEAADGAAATPAGGAGSSRAALEAAVTRLRPRFPALRLSVEVLGRARCVLMRSLVHNLLVGRSMQAVAAVSAAHTAPGSASAGTASSLGTLARDLTARVSAEAAATAVVRMVAVAAQHRSLSPGRGSATQGSAGAGPAAARAAAFASYCSTPTCAIKLASARCERSTIDPLLHSAMPCSTHVAADPIHRRLCGTRVPRA